VAYKEFVHDILVAQNIDFLSILDTLITIQVFKHIRAKNDYERQRNAETHHLDRGVQLVSRQES
jgi:hypothetical protein